jgi:hypothetical protein
MKVRRVIFPSVSKFSSSFNFDMITLLLIAGSLVTAIQWLILKTQGVRPGWQLTIPSLKGLETE